MSVNDIEAFIASMWDWKVLDGCFRKGSVSDIDGVYEWKGHFLYFETKGRGVQLNYGQELAMKHRVRDGLSTYLLLWGRKEKPEQMRVYYPAHLGTTKDSSVNLEILRTFCKGWVRYAERTPWIDAVRAAAEVAEE